MPLYPSHTPLTDFLSPKVDYSDLLKDFSIKVGPYKIKDLEHDNDLDYESNRKLSKIDYYYNDPYINAGCTSTIPQTRISMWDDDTRSVFATLLDQLKMKPYQSCFVLPNHISPANPMSVLTSTVEPTASEEMLTKYPIQNKSFIEYNSDSTILPPVPLVSWSEVLTEADNFVSAGVPVFIGRSRNIRDEEGDIIDPWGRSMHTHRAKYTIQRLRRRQTEVLANYCKEILAWITETTVDGMKVAFVVWEEVQMHYVRKSTEENFLRQLHPTERLKSPSYII